MKILESKYGIWLIEQYGKDYIRWDAGSISDCIVQIEISKEEKERILNKEVSMEGVINYYENRGLCEKNTLRDSLIMDYLLTFNTYSKDRILKFIEKLRTHMDIFFEFYYYVLDEKFIEPGLVIEGFSAKQLYDTLKLTPLGAYNYLIYLRENPQDALSDLKAGLPRK